jgi:hypothetical protein
MNRDLNVYLRLRPTPLEPRRPFLERLRRLRRGVSLAEAEAEMNSVAERLEQEFPTSNGIGESI